MEKLNPTEKEEGPFPNPLFLLALALMRFIHLTCSIRRRRSTCDGSSKTLEMLRKPITKTIFFTAIALTIRCCDVEYVLMRTVSIRCGKQPHIASLSELNEGLRRILVILEGDERVRLICPYLLSVSCVLIYIYL